MISVLIRANDEKVFDCIDSVKNSSIRSNIIVSLYKDGKILEKISDLNLKYVIVPRRNGSITTNRGLQLVKSKKVLITDSDTVFDKKCIEIIDKSLDKNQVVKCKIIFKDNGTIVSKAIANLRRYFNSKNNKMFTPGLGFRMSINSKIGGYYFDNKVAWSEDSEFSRRVEKNGLKTHFERRAVVIHPAVEIKHDLASAFLTGANKVDNKNIIEIVSKRLKTHKVIHTNYGLITLIYSVIWYVFFDFGKMSKYLGSLGKNIQTFSWKY